MSSNDTRGVRKDIAESQGAVQVRQIIVWRRWYLLLSIDFHRWECKETKPKGVFPNNDAFTSRLFSLPKYPQEMDYTNGKLEGLQLNNWR